MLIFVWQNVRQISHFTKGNAHFCVTKCQTNQWFFKGKSSFFSGKCQICLTFCQREKLIFVRRNVRQIIDFTKGNAHFCLTKCQTNQWFCKKEIFIFVRQTFTEISDFTNGNGRFCLTKYQTNQWLYKGKCSFVSDKMSDKLVILQREMLIFVWQNVRQISHFRKENAHFCLTK